MTTTPLPIRLTPDEKRLRAIILYCRGVKSDFPETAIWMDNIIKLAEGKIL